MNAIAPTIAIIPQTESVLIGCSGVAALERAEPAFNCREYIRATGNKSFRFWGGSSKGPRRTVGAKSPPIRMIFLRSSSPILAGTDACPSQFYSARRLAGGKSNEGGIKCSDRWRDRLACIPGLTRWQFCAPDSRRSSDRLRTRRHVGLTMRGLATVKIQAGIVTARGTLQNAGQKAGRGILPRVPCDKRGIHGP